ncbi:hypothetical protein Tco_1508548 [Tanacetum coccineum]
MTAPSTNSTNDVNTAKPAYEVSTVSPYINTASPQVSTDNFSDNAMYDFMVENPNGSNLLQQDLEQIHEDDLEAMDLKSVYTAKTSYPSAHKNMVPRAVLLKSGLTPLNTARSVYTTQPKPTVHSARSMSHFSKQAQSTDQRPFYKKTTLTNRYFHQKANTIMGHYYTVRPRAVNTARPYTAPVNVVWAKRVNVVKTSACWVWRHTRPNGASLVFRRNNYINARGRSKSVMAWVPKGN